jgi:predicted Fe-Mo cluster-binding NifX family protein
MRLAVAIWDDRISPVFDVSRRILVMDIEKGKVVGKRIEMFTNDNPIHKLSRLTELKVNTLICGAISRTIADLLNQHRIHIIPFITGDRQKVVAAFLTGTLPNSDLSMPGWWVRRRFWQPGARVLDRSGVESNDSGVYFSPNLKGGKSHAKP